MKTIPPIIKKVLFNKSGQASYIEFAVGFVMLVVLLTVVLQVYGLMQAETVMMNTAKDVLRRVELNGGKPAAGTDINSEVKNNLTPIRGIDPSTINVLVGGTPISSVPTGRYQLRQDITVQVKATYNFKMFGVSVASVPITSSYTGSSEKFNKNLGYTPLLN